MRPRKPAGLQRSGPCTAGDASLSSIRPLEGKLTSTREKAADHDLNIGVVLGVQDSRTNKHLIRNTARLDTCAKMRQEILDIVRAAHSQRCRSERNQKATYTDNFKGKTEPPPSPAPKSKPKATGAATVRAYSHCEKHGHVKSERCKEQETRHGQRVTSRGRVQAPLPRRNLVRCHGQLTTGRRVS